LNGDLRVRLEQDDCSRVEDWGLVSVKSEIIQRAEADRICVRILSKGLRAPADVAEVVNSIPWCAAIPSVSYGTIVWPTWMLRWCVESDIAYGGRRICSGIKLKGSNSGFEVLVINGILIVPNADIWSCHLITNPENAVVSGIGFDPNYRSSAPSHNRRLLSHGAADG